MAKKPDVSNIRLRLVYPYNLRTQLDQKVADVESMHTSSAVCFLNQLGTIAHVFMPHDRDAYVRVRIPRIQHLRKQPVDQAVMWLKLRLVRWLR